MWKVRQRIRKGSTESKENTREEGRIENDNLKKTKKRRDETNERRKNGWWGILIAKGKQNNKQKYHNQKDLGESIYSRELISYSSHARLLLITPQ